MMAPSHNRRREQVIDANNARHRSAHNPNGRTTKGYARIPQLVPHRSRSRSGQMTETVPPVDRRDGVLVVKLNLDRFAG
jgi:hypothetical protein